VYVLFALNGNGVCWALAAYRWTCAPFQLVRYEVSCLACWTQMVLM